MLAVPDAQGQDVRKPGPGVGTAPNGQGPLIPSQGEEGALPSREVGFHQPSSPKHASPCFTRKGLP